MVSKLNSACDWWAAIVTAAFMAFAVLAVGWQFKHYNDPEDRFASVVQTIQRGEALAGTSDILKREYEIFYANGAGRDLDLLFPEGVRVFMTDMTGPTNYSKIGYYFWFTYYLFPREVGTSLDHVTRQTKDGFVGTTSESNQVILAHGYDIRLDLNGSTLQYSPLHGMAGRKLANPAWFDSWWDWIIAFLLPLLTALAGMWLLRFLFPALGDQMSLPEQLAGSLGLGMMAVAALTLGVKLCGFHGRGLVLTLAAAGAIAEIWRDRVAFFTKATGSLRQSVRSPVWVAFMAVSLLVFLALFRIAGLEGLTDGDAMRWMLKAKIIHLCTGAELVQWFSNPRLAHAHLDYPTLLPSVHAATYDSIGHVDEFVTKFWHVWMLFFLWAALTSLNRAGARWFHAPLFALLALLLLPVTQSYGQMEGSTMPMVFFTVLGCVQCAIWIIERKPARLGLGLTLLFGGAMTHLEGFIFLGLAGGWIFLAPSARPPLEFSVPLRRLLAFWLLAALPYLCLRAQIPSLQYESGWTGYATHNPGATLGSWPGVFLIMVARWFVNPDLANWSGDGGMFHWIGKWDGFPSLYNQLTLGLPWLCLLVTGVLWFAFPVRRQVVLWMLAILAGAIAVFSLVFSSFTGIQDLNVVIRYTDCETTARYLLPLLVAWFATVTTLVFAETPRRREVPGN